MKKHNHTVNANCAPDCPMHKPTDGPVKDEQQPKRNEFFLQQYKEHPEMWAHEPCAVEHKNGQVCILPVGHPVEDIPENIFDVLDAHEPVHQSDGDFGEKQWIECTCGEEYGPDLVVGYNFKNPMDTEMAVWKLHRNQKVQEYIHEAIMSPGFISRIRQADPQAHLVLAAAFTRIVGGDR